MSYMRTRVAFPGHDYQLCLLLHLWLVHIGVTLLGKGGLDVRQMVSEIRH